MEKRNEAAAREVRRDLQDKIRSDWVFHWPELPTGSPPHNSTTGSSHPETTHSLPSVDRSSEALDWRERFYGSSDSDCDLDAEGDGAEATEARQNAGLRESTSSKTSYEFESPDTVDGAIQRRRLARKRKRRKLHEEEMEWNTGLACFDARRNAWTGARMVQHHGPGSDNHSGGVTVEDVGRSFKGHVEATKQEEEMEWNTGLACFNARRNAWTSAQMVQHHGPGSNDHSNGVTVEATGRNPEGHIEATKDGQHSHSASAANPAAASAKRETMPSQETEEGDVVIPILPPLVSPYNPIRAGIDPSIYPSLYSNIVLQSLSPSIPVNLSDIVSACVRGWQAAGDWPPKATSAELAIARRRTTQMNGTLKLSFKNRKCGTVAEGVGGDGQGGGVPEDGGTRRKSGHLRKGVAQMKRVFRLSGSSGTGTPGSHAV